MSFVLCPRSCAATIVIIPFLTFIASWFNPRELRYFSAAGYDDSKEVPPGPPPREHIQLFEGQQHTALYIKHFIDIQLIWAQSTCGASFDRSSSKLGLVELFILKLHLLAESSLPFPPFQCDLCCAQDEFKARYVVWSFSYVTQTFIWPCGLVEELVSETYLHQENLLPPGDMVRMNSRLLFWSGKICFERCTHSMVGYFNGLHHREVEVLASRALEGRYVTLLVG